MTTLIGSLSAYLQSKWTLTTPVGVADIHWNENWFNPLFPYTPQVTVTDLASPKLEQFNSSGTITIRYNPQYVVNVWCQIPPGSAGTQEAKNAQDMRLEVAKAFRSGVSNAYGGSLSPFSVVLPVNDGVPRHELDRTPKVLRYEVTVVATTNNEP